MLRAKKRLLLWAKLSSYESTVLIFFLVNYIINFGKKLLNFITSLFIYYVFKFSNFALYVLFILVFCSCTLCYVSPGRREL